MNNNVTDDSGDNLAGIETSHKGNQTLQDDMQQM